MAPTSIIRRVDHINIPLAVLIRLFLAGYFVLSGIQKVIDPVVFLKNIRLYGFMPEDPAFLLNASAIVLPWLEIVCGVALALGLAIRGAGLILAIMLAVFTPAILLRGLAISLETGTPFFDVAFDCGCGAGVVVTWVKLCKNTGLFALVVVTVLSRCRRFALDALMDRRRTFATTCDQCGATMDTSDGSRTMPRGEDDASAGTAPSAAG